MDDEPLARKCVRHALAGRPDVELVGEARDGEQALGQVRELTPDLLLLDVQMPGLDGFDVLRALDPPERPEVVFITAYDRHALRAFDIHAIDYVLKPFEDERLHTAIGRARDRIRAGRRIDPALLRSLVEAARSPEPEPRPLARITVPEGEGHRFVAVEEITRVDAERNYVRVHTRTSEHLVRGTLREMARRLPDDRFCRVHRSTILNLDRIREVQPYVGGDAIAILVDGERVRVSRRYRKALLQPLG